jgi:hypothetical protein
VRIDASSLWIAAAFAILGAHHRHRRQERDADRAGAVEATCDHPPTHPERTMRDYGFRAGQAEPQ